MKDYIAIHADKNTQGSLLDMAELIEFDSEEFDKLSELEVNETLQLEEIRITRMK